ncbi:MAG TPA: efflux RND transporter periplasmic adaptor subunit [Verrucomicrobiae bacterium]|jgi:RND family efflux transporter MFP subunit
MSNESKGNRHVIWVLVAVAVIITIAFIYLRKRPAPPVVESSPPTVPVARVQRENLALTITRAAEFRPYVAVELHAKVSGYLDKMNVDFGDHVKAGQLLATIEVPELQDELNNAIAVERRAEADYTNAHLIYSRLMDVNRAHPNLVAQQEIDTATSKDLETQAAIAAAQADVGKYRTLVGYTQISAPFDGVVTRRYVDPGALVEAGTSSANTMPLLEISDNFKLRMDVPVSVSYVKDIRVGDEVEVKVESLGEKPFIGRFTRSTLKVNHDTRTMTAEIEVENPNLELIPGMYGSLAFQAERRPQALSIPVEAIPSGQTHSAFVVDAQNEVEERPITLGLDTPTKYEVLSGLKEGEMVVLGSRSRITVGEKVEPKMMESLAQK